MIFLYIRRMLEIPQHADILGHLASLPSNEAQQKHHWLMEHERQLALNAQPAPGAIALIEHLYAEQRHLAILTPQRSRTGITDAGCDRPQ